jgi:hypothetical protein
VSRKVGEVTGDEDCSEELRGWLAGVTDDSADDVTGGQEGECYGATLAARCTFNKDGLQFRRHVEWHTDDSVFCAYVQGD